MTSVTILAAGLLCILMHCIQTIDAQCPVTMFPGTPAFGADCRYRCHCKNDERCDSTTGECANGCEYGWMGPACQYRNVAKDYFKAQNVGGTDTPAHFSTKAVDQDINTCCKTATGAHLYDNWWIRLKRSYLVSGLVLQVPQEDLENFKEFRVEYGPTSTSFSNLCYQHPNIPGTTRMEISCQQTVQMEYIRIRLAVQNTPLRLCEVEIFGGRDVAFHRPTNSTSVYMDGQVEWSSSKAVDGLRQMTSAEDASDTCFASESENNPSWMVNLGAGYDIQDIYFFARWNYPLQRNAFYIEIYNASGGQRTLIFNDTPSGNEDDYHPRDTRLSQVYSQRQYVKISRTFPTGDTGVMTICEIQTFAECPMDTCGWQCELVCKCASMHTGSNKILGTCPEGCKDRWTGPNQTCNTECLDTEWGPQCENICGNCEQPPCSVTNGHCPHGCSGPWKFPLCVDDCDGGTYGKNCSHLCGHCENADHCNTTSGHCPGHCEPGWNPPLCDEACSNKMYGVDCMHVCGSCLGNQQCDVVNGTCHTGCDPGYDGLQCKTECQDGRYGYNCNETCGYCVDMGQCNKISGQCETGCLPGYRGDYCNMTCAPGTYGIGCSVRCHNCYNNHTCHHVNGSCPDGCEAGFKPETCSQPCDVGWYGYSCNTTCGQCKDMVECNVMTGTCSTGCKPGYTEMKCDAPCPNGRYGDACSMRCHNCYNNHTCHHVNGDCPDGCEAGFKPETCSQICDAGWYGYSCNTTCAQCKDMVECNVMTGACATGCKEGYQGNMCDSPCNVGTYGLNCSKTCGHCYSNTSCHHEMGICESGCHQDYTDIYCKQAKDNDGGGAVSAGVIGGIGAGIVLLLLCAVLALIIIKRRRNMTKKRADSVPSTMLKENHRQNERPTTSNENSPDENIYKNVSITNEGASSNGYASGDPPPPRKRAPKAAPVVTEESMDEGVDAVYDNMVKTKPLPKSIAVKDLRESTKMYRKDRSDLYADFFKLPIGLQHPTKEALKPENRCKNRYKNMYPYDGCRVVLPVIAGVTGSDYINASYIDGFQKPRKYIAAQGATEQTVEDVWRMVWDENIKVVVMLTQCVEAGKYKCWKYWFEETDDTGKTTGAFGDYQIELVSADTYTDFTVRTLKCTKLSLKKSRVITQYHFTAWPDKGVPDSALSVLQFWNKVRQSKDVDHLPWMVHCSAGVGRTGTFIALDYLYEQGQCEGHVTVNVAVDNLRQQRLTMVQTKEQYVYLHLVVCEALSPIGQVCKKEEYNLTYGNTVTDQNSDWAQQNEFQAICEETEFEQSLPHADGEEDSNINHTGLREKNKARSRNLDTVPVDAFRPRLAVAEFGENDFINAVFIPTFSAANQIIMTQYPLTNTVEDFLRMVWDFSVDTVILLEENADTTGRYWPQDGQSTMTIGTFTAELLSEKSETNWTQRKIKYTSTDKNKSGSREITQYQFTAWPANSDVPLDSGCMLNFIESIQRNGTAIPIVVQCLDGAVRSGLFTVIWCLLDRVRTESEIGVAETVRAVRLRRPLAINSLEQYKYCHNVVQYYLDSFEVYMNAM